VVKKQRLTNRDKPEAMKPHAGRFASGLHELVRSADESEDESLFGLLLSIEHKIRKEIRRDVRLGIEKLGAVKLVRHRRPTISKLSRYVE
jgi:hypothetical protein